MTAFCSWAMQREAAARLGVSERTLHRWRAAGLLRAGEHWRRKFPNPNSPLLYHLERCERTMCEASARHPGRLEVAPLHSSQKRSQRFEVAPYAGGEQPTERLLSLHPPPSPPKPSRRGCSTPG
jgi:hypothetical protein